MTTTNATKKRKNQQRQAVIRVVLMAVILICVNILASYFHTKLDLTKEKRFTLSKPTCNLLHNMNDVAVVDVYLKGKFPAGFQRLAEATRERLESFKEYGGTHIVYRFIDPFDGKTEQQKGDVFKDLESRGVMGMNLKVHEGAEEGYSEKIIFPWALVRYHGKEKAVSLLENHQGVSALENLNNSECLLEYKLASAIHTLTIPDKQMIGYVVGNGETLGWNTYDGLTSISRIYHVDTLDLVANTYIPSVYEAIIINKPTLPFADKEKFKIDQYIMNGGKVLWMLDMVRASLDSFQNHSEQFIAMDAGLNLDDQLFKYGVRINSDLIEDVQCNVIPLVVGMSGDRPQIELRKWLYFPILVPTSKHPIVNNMGAITAMFANSIDTIATPGITKTILLQSSKYSRTTSVPVRVSLSMAKFDPRPELFNKPYRPVAVLVEGRFKSIFQNRLAPAFLQVLKDSLKQPFKPIGDSDNSMIVVSDGDIMGNDVSAKMGPAEVGYWQPTREKFANKDFLFNCLEYLTDRSGLLEARSKDLRLRLLDSGRIQKEKTQWQVINIVIPIALVLIFASCYLFFRKRRYEIKA